MSSWAQVMAGACAFLHLLFFLKEGPGFGSSLKTFRAQTQGKLGFGDFNQKEPFSDANALRIFALNMSCCNLALAVGAAYSVWLSRHGRADAATLMSYLSCVMIFAGIVLGLTASWLWKFALAQAGLAAICLFLIQTGLPAARVNPSSFRQESLYRICGSVFIPAIQR